METYRGKHLATKDGRKIGNAIIESVSIVDGAEIFSLITDFGNRLIVNRAGLEDYFHLDYEHPSDEFYSFEDWVVARNKRDDLAEQADKAFADMAETGLGVVAIQPTDAEVGSLKQRIAHGLAKAYYRDICGIAKKVADEAEKYARVHAGAFEDEAQSVLDIVGPELRKFERMKSAWRLYRHHQNELDRLLETPVAAPKEGQL